MIEFINDGNVAYTRYLYNHIEVRQSLFVSLLNHDIDESLYWAYELYYSGYKEDTCDFILDIYSNIYKHDNHKYERQIMIDLDNIKTSNNARLYGNLIATLSTLQYDLQVFCKTYMKIDIKQDKQKKYSMLIDLGDEYIKQFETVSTEKNKYCTLKMVIKYPIRNNVNSLFNILLPEYDDLYKMMYYHWLYYAARNPVWYDRICHFNGSIDDEKKSVDFDNDDNTEEFHETWGYEPDEQPNVIQHYIMGKKNTLQMGIKDFCKKYNLHMKLKKIPTNNITMSFSEK